MNGFVNESGGGLGTETSCVTGYTNYAYNYAVNKGIETAIFAEGSKYFFGAIDDAMATIIGWRIDEVKQEEGCFNK